MGRITKIGSNEILVLTLVYTGAKIYLGLPRIFIDIGGTAGWIVPLLSGALAFGLWKLEARLLRRFPGQNIMRINEEVAGPVLGTVLNMISILFIISTAGNLLREFSETLLVTALPEAPISSIAFLFVLPMLAAVYLGIEPLARSTYISFPFIFFGTVGILLALFPFWNFLQIYPLLGNGLGKILTYALPLSSAYGEVLILSILVPYFSFGSQKIERIGSRCIILLTIFFSFSTLIYQIVISYPSATESFLPYYQMARSIYLGRFLQRVEALFIMFWTFSAFLRLAIGLFIGAYVYKETFKIPFLKPLLPALAILYLSIALTPRDFIESINLEYTRLMVGSLFTFGIPLGILALAFLRGKGEKHGQAGKQD